jgi:mono/diheme cytochrome c family protein
MLAARAPTTVKSAARHQFYRREGLPAAYRGKTNPLTPSIPFVLAGADDYDLNCAACHGPAGLGNGQPKANIQPAPADLSGSVSDPSIKDDFLYWTIAEGGAQFGTDMPAYKNDLTEHQIWRIMVYMRAAFANQTARADTNRSLASKDGGR